jgi:hypothetical protein
LSLATKSERVVGLLFLFYRDRVIWALVDTSSAVKALLLVDDCDVLDRDGTLRADIHASTASNAFILVDLRWHPNTSESLAFRNSSPHINVRDHLSYYVNISCVVLLNSGLGRFPGSDGHVDREIRHVSANY